MDALCGMTSTGRIIKGPASDLVELDAESGLKHTAVLFDPKYRGHPALTSSMQVLLGFLEDPGVSGMLKLADHDPEEAAFVYPTGTAWSVAEVIRTFADLGRAPGIKAGLELCYLGAEILLEASEVGEEHGIYCHGSLTPWRIFLKADGQVRIGGYGLPQIDILEYVETRGRKPDQESFRYCPPERLEGEPEDISADLFTLTLVGLEMMMGRPVYDGLRDDIIQQATRAEGLRRLYQWRDRLPESIRDVMGRALKPDPDNRYRGGNDYVYAVHDLLQSIDAEGPSLIEVMQKTRGILRRGGKALQGGMTATLTKAELAELAKELEEIQAAELPGPRKPRDEDEEEEDEDKEQPRWGKVARGRGEVSAGRSSAGRGSGGNLRERLKSSRRGRSGSGRGRGDDLRERLRRDRSAPADRKAPSERTSHRSAPRRRRRTPQVGDDEKTNAQELLAKLRKSGSKPEAEADPEPPAKPPKPAVKRAEAKEASAALAGSSPNRIQLEVSIDGGEPLKLAIDPSRSLAAEAQRLAMEHVGERYDLAGNLLAVWRLEQGDELYMSTVKAEVLKPDELVHLAPIENRVLRITFDIRADDPIRFSAPVGTAVPARSLVGYLVDWLELDDDEWRLEVDGEAVDPLQTLDEFEIGDRSTVVVKR